MISPILILCILAFINNVYANEGLNLEIFKQNKIPTSVFLNEIILRLPVESPHFRLLLMLEFSVLSPVQADKIILDFLKKGYKRPDLWFARIRSSKEIMVSWERYQYTTCEQTCKFLKNPLLLNQHYSIENTKLTLQELCLKRTSLDISKNIIQERKTKHYFGILNIAFIFAIGISVSLRYFGDNPAFPFVAVSLLAFINLLKQHTLEVQMAEPDTFNILLDQLNNELKIISQIIKRKTNST